MGPMCIVGKLRGSPRKKVVMGVFAPVVDALLG
jgi:hypothetical protein